MSQKDVLTLVALALILWWLLRRRSSAAVSTSAMIQDGNPVDGIGKSYVNFSFPNPGEFTDDVTVIRY